MLEGDDVKPSQRQACFGTFHEFTESTVSTPLLSFQSSIMIDNYDYDNDKQQREEQAPFRTFGRTSSPAALKPLNSSNHLHGN